MISKSFIKSSFIYTIIGSLPLASSILLLPFYGNTNLLSTSDFGLLAIYITISELARALFTFSTDSFLGFNFIHYSADNNSIKKFIGSSTIFMLVYGIGITIAFSFIGDYIFKVAFPDKNIQYFPLGLLSALTGLFNGIFKAYSNLMIYREKPNPFFWSNILHFVLVVGISVSVLYIFPQSLVGPIWGRFLSSFVTFLWAVIYFVKESQLKYDKTIISRLISYSAPLYIYTILQWVVTNIDKYFVLGLLSNKDLAIFDFATKIVLAIDFLQTGLTSAIYPKIFKFWKNNNDEPQGTIEINKYFHVFTVINLIGIPLYFISIPLIVPYVVNNSELYASFKLLPILFAGMIVRIWYNYLIAPVVYFKQTRILPVIFTFVAIFQVFTTYGLIKIYSIEGAVWASFLTKIFQVGLLFFFIKRFYTLKVNFKKLIFYPTIYILLLISVEIFFKNINLLITNCIHLIILTTTGYFLFRKEINPKGILKMLGIKSG